MQKKNNIKIILATDKNGGLGYKGRLAWKNKEDLKHFSTKTKGCTLIMGRNTYDECKDLKGREKVVVTSKKIDGVDCYTSLEEALYNTRHKNCWVIGGASIYNYIIDQINKNKVLKYKDVEFKVSMIEHTLIDKEYKCDVFVNIDSFDVFSEKKGETCIFRKCLIKKRI